MIERRDRYDRLSGVADYPILGVNVTRQILAVAKKLLGGST